MIRINENGDLEATARINGLVVHATEGTKLNVTITAAELKAAFAERGMVMISVEDLELALDEDAPFSSRSARDRLREAIKEAP